MSALWRPNAQAIEASHLTAFRRHINQRHGAGLESYEALQVWSLQHRDLFWNGVWEYCGIKGQKGVRLLDESRGMFKARFFPDSLLNFAENLIQQPSDEEALVFWGEDQVKRRLTHQELHAQVAALSRHLRTLGVGPGDRVAGFVPNTPEALIAMLATASIGAVWSSCSPDFGVEGVLDRFGQIEPKVLVSADGYIYAGKTHDCIEKLGGILKGLPTVEQVIVFSYAGTQHHLDTLPKLKTWASIIESDTGDSAIKFERVPFNHPLYILYSSGTTGAPKCIVHSVGGTLLQHLKEHQLHCDIKPGDRVFYYTTCGWMMWNWQISALASGAALLLYDGSPFHPDGNILFDYAEAEKMTHFGTAAKYIDTLHKEGYTPQSTHDLSALKMITSTGSPLVPESFDYVYGAIASHSCLASISGGSDIISCFMLGNPTAPVYRGEIQTAGLGMDVDVFDESGHPVSVGEKGELVCKSAFPSMPLEFWNDPGDARYRAAYFERFPGLWCHGDFVAKTAQNGYIIYGRSDAILNPGGVRIGTAEIYRQVEQFPEILEGLVIGQDWQGDVRVVLFVKLREGVALDEDLTQRIKRAIRSGASPRHVPGKIVAVEDIPRTKSGKLVELAVRDVVHGREVKNLTALANPEALAFFKNREELRT